MNNIPAKAVRRQADICLTLIPELDVSVVDRHKPADQTLAHVYRRHPEYGSRDRRFFSNAVFSWFRWRGWLKEPTRERIAAAILLDATEIPAQLEYMYRNFKDVAGVVDPGPASPRPPACNAMRSIAGRATVVSCRRPTLTFANTDSALAGIEPLGPLHFEDKASRLQSLLKTGPLCIEQLTPKWVSDYLFIPANCKPEAHLHQCIQSFQSRPPTWLRLRADQRNRAVQSLNQAGIEIETHPLIQNAVFIKGAANSDLARLPGAEVQDLASQCAGICCAPMPGEQWWDICAGSGGKSLHLADLMHDTGLVLATDIRPSILDQLSKRLKKNNYRSIKISLWDGVAELPAAAAQAGPAPGTRFDGIIIDAPCSGLGTWARNPDARWRTTSEQIRDYMGIQRNLLEIAAQKIKSGGRLIYSTCTLTGDENTGLISHFLEQHDEFHPKQVVNPLNHKPTGGLIWIWPWEWNSNGMFIAVLEKD